MAFLISWMLAGVAGCTVDSDATLDFTNKTSEPVWVAHNPDGPNGFGVPDRMWINVEPDVPVVINDGGCICPGEDWAWSGVGDHD